MSKLICAEYAEKIKNSSQLSSYITNNYKFYKHEEKDEELDIKTVVFDIKATASSSYQNTVYYHAEIVFLPTIRQDGREVNYLHLNHDELIEIFGEDFFSELESENLQSEE